MLMIGVTPLPALMNNSRRGSGSGNVIYEFDVEGGSAGPLGSTIAPGLGNPEEFDYKNAAERIYYALSVDPHNHGQRSVPSINY